jgi:hypothetical protein
MLLAMCLGNAMVFRGAGVAHLSFLRRSKFTGWKEQLACRDAATRSTSNGNVFSRSMKVVHPLGGAGVFRRIPRLTARTRSVGGVKMRSRLGTFCTKEDS